MTEIFNGLSDFFTAHWGEIVAILTSSVFLGAVLNFIFRLILIKVQEKSTKRVNAPLQANFDTLKQQMEEALAKMKTAFNENVDNYTKVFEQKLEELLKKYKEAKQEIYNQIVKGSKETEKLLEDLQEKTVEIGELVESVQNTEKNADILPETTEVEEQFEKEQKVEEITEKTENTKQQDEYIVVTKTYGE